MKRTTAEGIIDAANRIDKIIDEMDRFAWEIEDETERRKILTGIANCIHTLYYHVTREVVRDFPDLHPDFQPPGDQPDHS